MEGPVALALSRKHWEHGGRARAWEEGSREEPFPDPEIGRHILTPTGSPRVRPRIALEGL